MSELSFVGWNYPSQLLPLILIYVVPSVAPIRLLAAIANYLATKREVELKYLYNSNPHNILLFVLIVKINLKSHSRLLPYDAQCDHMEISSMTI